MINLFVGYDEREALAYHVFCQSVLEKSSQPVAFIPLHLGLLAGYKEKHRDGTNAFIYSRFLVPWMMKYHGWAIFADSDMLVVEDIASIRPPEEAVAVVKHPDYKAWPRKYCGTPMESQNPSYPRKNWSSFIVWNCSHPDNKVLTPEFVEGKAGEYLHRFGWCNPEALDPRWNRLVNEQVFTDVFNYHFTLGVPGIPHYSKDQGSDLWKAAVGRVNRAA